MDKDNKQLEKATKQLQQLASKAEKMKKKAILNGQDGSSSSIDPKKAAELRSMLAKLRLAQSQTDKSSPEHKFWSTQPVPQYDDQEITIANIGPIEPSIPVDQVEKNPHVLPKDFEWCEVDMQDEKEVKELYELLTTNYVEDDGAHFRFDYSAEFLKWALLPPQWKKSWHVGVRVAANKKLVAFISGIPADMRTYTKTQRLIEINFLCVHKKLRSKRLAPVLIREVTRRSHMEGIFQAVYTAGTQLPKPVSNCQYFHRSLNPKKLVECKFSQIKRNSTLAGMIKYYRVPDQPNTPGLREMRAEDVPAVRSLLNKYLTRFDFAPSFETDEDVQHWILPKKDVVWSYVVESPDTHAITDMFSFYSLPSTVIGNPKHKKLNAAYLFYYAVDVPEICNASDAAEIRSKQAKHIQARLKALFNDALVMAKKADFDVVNALKIMDNSLFLEDTKFGPGDGHLNYYLYNWKCPDVADHKVGLVML